MASVHLTNVVKEYSSGNRVVHGINLEIKQGEFMVLVGPSGCGKSTTLRMIAGLEDISSGEISIGGKVVNDVAPKDRNISMVFQNYALYPHMTVYENIAFGLKMAKFSSAEIESRVNEVAKMLEIEHLLKRKPKEMSGGQRQRVALGRAIARRPEVFLFDEPLSNLDAKLRVSMRVRLAQLHKDLQNDKHSNTMIYVTHDQVEAMTLGHRICVMESGYIRQVDTPMNLYQYPANKFVAEFIGSPAMNFIHGVLSKQGDKTIITINNCNLTLPKSKADLVQDYIGKEVAFGIRSEHISMSETSTENSIPSKIDIIERMGNEEMIYFYCGKTLFIAREQPLLDFVLDKNKDYYFAFDMEYAHLFDLNTEQNISLPLEYQSANNTSTKFDFDQNIEILKKYIGSVSNIKEVTHCVTRVRITIFKDSQVDQAALKGLGVNYTIGKDQVHFIVGKDSQRIANLFK